MIRITSVTDSYRTQFTNGRHTAVADIPIEKGGDGTGFGPHELVEAALATCLTITVRMAARKHDIPLAEVRCEVRIDRTDPATVRLRYHLSLDGPLTPEQSDRLRAAAANCPVAKTLTGPLVLEPVTEAGDTQ